MALGASELVVLMGIFPMPVKVRAVSERLATSVTHERHLGNEKLIQAFPICSQTSQPVTIRTMN